MASDLVWLLLTAIAVAALLPNVLSLLQGLRLRGTIHRAMRVSFGAYLPAVAVVLPVRGLDDGFDANLRSVLSQVYPRFRVLVVVDDFAEPAAARAKEIGTRSPKVPLEVVLSEPASLPGKVNALRSGLSHLEPGDEAIVFADSDIRPPKDWLRQLLQPLADATVGVSTGFRWYVPPRATFWSLVRAEWNAVSANVLFDPRRAFVWGGSCAIRRTDLPKLRLEERWRDVLSDDLILAQAVRDAGLQIAYAPAALVPTYEGADRSTCVEWCLRQMTMATLYHPIVRRYAAVAFTIFNGSVVLGLVTLLLAGLWGPSFLVPAILFLAPMPAAIVKAALRRRALFSAAPDVAAAWKVPFAASSAAALAVPWLMAWGLVRTRRPTVVRWRGRLYDVTDARRIRLREG